MDKPHLRNVPSLPVITPSDELGYAANVPALLQGVSYFARRTWVAMQVTLP